MLAHVEASRFFMVFSLNPTSTPSQRIGSSSSAPLLQPRAHAVVAAWQRKLAARVRCSSVATDACGTDLAGNNEWCPSGTPLMPIHSSPAIALPSWRAF